MSDKKEISLEDFFVKVKDFQKQNITEFAFHNSCEFASQSQVLKIIAAVKSFCPELFLTLPVKVSVLDFNLVKQLPELYVSLELKIEYNEKNGNLLLDKKYYDKRIALLNNAGIVFGFNLDWGLLKNDTFKLFRERLDFAVSLYPNHIDFEQFADLQKYEDPKSTAVYSSKDLDFSRGMAFACYTFYTCGRAVPWFNYVLKALKINASSFFADFEEWQLCNNCAFETDFNPLNTPHIQIEKMQLLFLEEKFNEKHKSFLFNAVKDLVQLNGALSRAESEGEECIIETSYSADDIFSPAICDLVSFVENVTMENQRVKIFIKNGISDYKIL